MDVFDPATRSRVMGRVRGKDTKPEMVLRRALHALGLRHRLHVGALPGRPDLVWPRHKAAAFVHGCFWHRHEGCRHATTPADNAAFWAAKFERNVARDAAAIAGLTDAGWRVAVVWECALKRAAAPEVAREVAAFVRGAGPSPAHWPARRPADAPDPCASETDPQHQPT